MIVFDSAANTAVNSTARGGAWLVELNFKNAGYIRYTTWGDKITATTGETYVGLGNLVSVSGLTESDKLTQQTVELSFSIVNTSMLATVIGDASEYRGRSVRIFMQIIGEDLQKAGAPILRWSGIMDKVSVERSGVKASDMGGGKGSIKMSCYKYGAANLQNSEGERISDAQQQLLFPGDKGLEYIPSLIENPSLWLSKAFQKRKG